eukprot:gnl/MRDRNA2_/MRDRNA2_104643_c0_seq1.p1 gnl/MRDRNA2_/MRDRNA2_104643_c0~~gnl/MRDRNA2_/MRDRNA2_104643_c0_seq1.p1  ORF type:complete len:494 (-),score=107.89 gnl/MRDRNA2_/MRDRNA2_104643_c0_seq1:14-1495(-)
MIRCIFAVFTFASQSVQPLAASLPHLIFPRVNTLYFDGVEDLQWSTHSHSISSGQPLKGITVVKKGESHGAGLSLVAGRRGTEAPALEFCRSIQADNMIASTQAIPQKPKKPKLLNFAIFGTMVFSIKGKKYECKEMRIGQGHMILSFANNWWISASYCHRSSSSDVYDVEALKCGNYSNCGLTFHSTGDSDHFRVATMHSDAVAAEVEKTTAQRFGNTEQVASEEARSKLQEVKAKAAQQIHSSHLEVEHAHAAQQAAEANATEAEHSVETKLAHAQSMFQAEKAAENAERNAEKKAKQKARAAKSAETEALQQAHVAEAKLQAEEKVARASSQQAHAANAKIRAEEKIAQANTTQQAQEIKSNQNTSEEAGEGATQGRSPRTGERNESQNRTSRRSKEKASNRSSAHSSQAEDSSKPGRVPINVNWRTHIEVWAPTGYYFPGIPGELAFALFALLVLRFSHYQTRCHRMPRFPDASTGLMPTVGSGSVFVG